MKLIDEESEEDISYQRDMNSDYDDAMDTDQRGVFDATPGEIDDSSDSEHAVASSGRPAKNCWGYLTIQDKPFRKQSSTCKHCNSPVKHNKKAEKVEYHLKNCNAFR